MKNISFKTLFLFLTLATISSSANAQQTVEKVVVENSYLVYLPDGYNSDSITSWPLMMFLHGSGETGTDIEKVKVHGPAKKIEEGYKYPFIVITPQSQQYGWRPDLLINILNNVEKKYRVDKDRIYLTGLSMGGYGTWQTALDYPEVFAAIIPICGGGSTDKIWNLRNTPVWCFHGAKDNVVPLSESENMVNALKTYNPNVKLTVYPQADHNSWTETYNNEDIYSWMLSHKRFKYEQKTLSKNLMNEYAGRYLTPLGDTLMLAISGDELHMIDNKGNVQNKLKASAKDLFYFDAERPDCAQFVRAKNNKISELTFFMKNRQRVYRKL